MKSLLPPLIRKAPVCAKKGTSKEEEKEARPSWIKKKDSSHGRLEKGENVDAAMERKTKQGKGVRKKKCPRKKKEKSEREDAGKNQERTKNGKKKKGPCAARRERKKRKGPIPLSQKEGAPPAAKGGGNNKKNSPTLRCPGKKRDRFLARAEGGGGTIVYLPDKKKIRPKN